MKTGKTKTRSPGRVFRPCSIKDDGQLLIPQSKCSAAHTNPGLPKFQSDSSPFLLHRGSLNG